MYCVCIDRDIVTPLALTAETFPKVITVLDSALSSAPKPVALRASSSTSTIFVSGSDLASYIQKLASSSPDAAFHEIDFTTLSSEAVTTGAKPAQPAKAQKEKEDARIEGAVQVAIGVKKEVDFAAWYTNVCSDLSNDHDSILTLCSRSLSRPTCSTSTPYLVATS